MGLGTTPSVTNVSASGGTETITGSAITTTGTIRGVEVVNAQASVASYAIVDDDRGKLITFTRVLGSVAVSIAQAGTAGAFPAGWYCVIKKVSGGATLTITPTTSTISGATTLDIATGQTVKIVSDGTNYQVEYFASNSTSAGITNSAPIGTIPKSVGGSGNLVASQITDDGTDIAGSTLGNVFWTSASQHVELAAGTPIMLIDVDGANSAINIDSRGGVTTIGDVNGVANATSLIINDGEQEIKLAGGNGSAFYPTAAASWQIGAASFPFNKLFVGNAANNSSQITGTFTGNQVATLPDATGTIALVGNNLGTVLSILSANATLASTTGTTYSSPGYGGTLLASTNEGQVGWVCPRAGTISTLYVITGSIAKVSTPTTVITIRKSGVDTAVTLTLTQTTATVSSDLVHSFSVAAGDVITMSFTTTGVAGVSTSIAGVSFVLN